MLERPESSKIDIARLGKSRGWPVEETAGTIDCIDYQWPSLVSAGPRSHLAGQDSGAQLVDECSLCGDRDAWCIAGAAECSLAAEDIS